MMRLASRLSKHPISRSFFWWQRPGRVLRERSISRRLPEYPGEYDAWIRTYDTLSAADHRAIRLHIQSFALRPTISLLLPLRDGCEAGFMSTVDSVRRQLYPHWELCIAPNSEPDRSRLLQALGAAGRFEPRLRWAPSVPSGRLASHLKAASQIAAGHYLAVIEPGDQLSEQALLLHRLGDRSPSRRRHDLQRS